VIGNLLDCPDDARGNSWVVYGTVVCETVIGGVVMENGVVWGPVDASCVFDGIVIDVDSSVVEDTISDAAAVVNDLVAGGVVDFGAVHGAVEDGASRSITSAFWI